MTGRVVSTADAVVLINHDRVDHVLLVRRADDSDAYPGHWALPGGLVDLDNPAEFPYSVTAARELAEETGLTLEIGEELRLFGLYGAHGRDPRGDYVSNAYWTRLYRGSLPEVHGGDDAAEARWFPLAELQPGGRVGRLAFDHFQIIIDALKASGGQK